VRCTRLVVLVWLASCGVRAPAPIDVDALLRNRGPVEARRDLVIRIAAEPRDVAAHLALARLAEQLQRPGEAVEQLEAVVALGGPTGVRWHDDDRARLARLIAARGRIRLARGAASALGDLERARQLGAEISDLELRRARVVGAIVALHHSDAEVRDAGRRILAGEAAHTNIGAANVGVTEIDAADRVAWAGARPAASAGERGRFGAWLWRVGARRAAWDELAAWRAGATVPHDGELEAVYLEAARWWTPLDVPGPAVAELDGPMRCAFAPCAPHEVVGDDARERAYVMAPLAPPARDPADVAAVVVITLHQALRGEVSWGAALAARLDLPALGPPAPLAALPRYLQPVVARLVGRSAPAADDAAAPEQRLVIAAERVLDGAGPAEIAGLLDDGPYGAALRAIAAPRAPFAGDARAEAVARYAGTVVPGTASREQLLAIAAGFARDPAIADRLSRDAIAGASDAAAIQATLGAVFDALGDPARARTAWQAAADASREPRFLRGLAEAEARQGDGDAALINATAAAAASGDPAVVWVAVAQALAGAGREVHALDAARSAIDLAGPETLPAALDVAIAASRALGRTSQAAALAVQRARVAPVGGTLGDRDPTDARAALEGHRSHASSAMNARLWVSSRWNPRDVEVRAALLAVTAADDPRHAVITGELVDLAGDRDATVGRAAAAALR
jgi:tetratricopeptide (TPR) repeat protein